MIRVVCIDPGTLSINVCPIADGKTRHLVDRLRVRQARGSVLDNLLFITPEAARERLGLRHG